MRTLGTKRGLCALIKKTRGVTGATEKGEGLVKVMTQDRHVGWNVMRFRGGIGKSALQA